MAIHLVQSYSKGTVLFAPGENAVAAYFILEGTIIASQGDQQVALGPGGVLGEVAFFKESDHTYAAICGTDVKALTVTSENSSQVCATQPLVARTIMRELALKIEEVNEFAFSQGILDDKPGSAQGKGWLPQGHPVFNERVPVEHSEFLFSSEVKCPICHTTFTGRRMRTSRLQLEEQRGDFRNIYRRFEPNYYYIWVCPKCLFAYPERQYGKISQAAIRRWRAVVHDNPPAESFEYDLPRTIHQVITSYYLAMATFQAVEASSDQWGNLWLRLLWMYEDLGEEELALKATTKAKEYFDQAMATISRSPAGDQQLYLILGELDLRLGNGGEAYRNFHAAATLTGGDPRYKRMGTDKIQDLRDQRHA